MNALRRCLFAGWLIAVGGCAALSGLFLTFARMSQEIWRCPAEWCKS